MTKEQLIEEITTGKTTELKFVAAIIRNVLSLDEYNSIPGKSSKEKAAHLLSEHGVKGRIIAANESALLPTTTSKKPITSDDIEPENYKTDQSEKDQKPLTAEEFYRNKIRELKPEQATITLSQETITAEQGMRWAHDFASQQNAYLKAELTKTPKCWEDLNKEKNHLISKDGIGGFHAAPVIRLMNNYEKEIESLQKKVEEYKEAVKDAMEDHDFLKSTPTITLIKLSNALTGDKEKGANNG